MGLWLRLGFPNAQHCQRCTGQAGSESPQRLSASDGLGQALAEFIELVVHGSPVVFWFLFLVDLLPLRAPLAAPVNRAAELSGPHSVQRTIPQRRVSRRTCA